MTDRTAMTLGRGTVYANGRLIGEVKSGVVRSDPPRPWCVGRVLDTPETARLSAGGRAEIQALEERCVYSNFNPMDGGRSRILIKVCDTAAEAQRIVFAHNGTRSWSIGPLEIERVGSIFWAALGVHRFGRKTLARLWLARVDGHWRIGSDFHEIERNIAAAGVVNHLIARTVNRPQPWTERDLQDAERRMQALAWSADDARVAAPASARAEAINKIGRARGFRMMDPHRPFYSSSRGWL